MKKTFVLSTQATLSSEKATRSFGGDNDIVIPMAVVEKLYSYNELPEKVKVASKFIDYLGTFSMKDLISTKGVKQDNGSVLRVMDCKEISDKVMLIRGLSDFYKRIFQVCLDLSISSNSQVILISQNPSVRMKAESLGIKSQPFKDEIFPAPEDQYKGRIEAYASRTVIDRFYKNKSISIKEVYQYNTINWIENMFVQLTAENGGSAIGRYTDGQIVDLIYLDQSIYKPQNSEQRMLMECLLAPPEVAPLVIVKGGAGTGKTFCALSAALEKLATYGKNGIYEQILVGSPTVTIDEDLGYLPGDIDEKVGPYLGGVKDNLKSIFKNASPEDDLRTVNDKVLELFVRHYVEIQPIGFLRGRSIPNRFFLLDEVQNIKPEILLDIITRAATGTKIVLAGDPTQVNTPGLNTRRNGLVYISEKMKGNSLCWQVTLDSQKTIRSELAKVAQQIL